MLHRLEVRNWIVDQTSNFQPSTSQPMQHQVILYSKPGCHLCEDAKRLLQSLQREFDFVIQEINIETDPTLFKNYFDKIPVLSIDNEKTLAAPIQIEDVRAALK